MLRRRHVMYEITFVWTADEAESMATWLESVDVRGPGDPLIELKERLYTLTGRDFLLDADGRYVV
jgi:hypothetical protein